MEKLESSVKVVPFTQEQVYNQLENLNHLSSVKDRMGNLPENVADKIKELTFDHDSLTLNVQGFNLTLRIIEREPSKCIKFQGENTPIPLNLWIQMLPVGEDRAKLKVTLRAELNMFMKSMLKKPLQEGVEKMADMLSIINYQ
ncbi:MAG: SRPBCC family protein [Bacteroidales bacterium]|nr:SRPBCC family protein [Bacteroidales bacterium]